MNDKNGNSQNSKNYYLDTTGAWMLDAFFDAELGNFEPRAAEYLAYLINAFCDPNAVFFGVMPERRTENVLPSFYEILLNENKMQPHNISHSDLSLPDDVVDIQFDIFVRQWKLYPKHLLNFVGFHTHNKVRPGFYNATKQEPNKNGIPDYVEAFLSKRYNRNTLIASCTTSEYTAFKQAFSIFSRGFIYARAASKCDASYITSPFRWSCTGFPEMSKNNTMHPQIMGAIALSAIKNNEIRSAKELYDKLIILRDNAQEFFLKISKLEEEIRFAGSRNNKNENIYELRKLIGKLVYGWTKGELTERAEKHILNLLTLLIGLIGCGALINIGVDVGTSVSISAESARAVRLFAVIFSNAPTRAGGFPYRRDWVKYHESSFPQSCGYCGAPFELIKNKSTCPLCLNGLVKYI